MSADASTSAIACTRGVIAADAIAEHLAEDDRAMHAGLHDQSGPLERGRDVGRAAEHVRLADHRGAPHRRCRRRSAASARRCPGRSAASASAAPWRCRTPSPTRSPRRPGRSAPCRSPRGARTTKSPSLALLISSPRAANRLEVRAARDECHVLAGPGEFRAEIPAHRTRPENRESHPQMLTRKRRNAETR